MADLMELSSPQVPARQTPFREDCWTEEATSTLVDTWGRRYLELNRGNLRQKDWQEVADAVNVLHGHTKKARRTDVQCKNRIDTLKKKYKTEKAKISESNGNATSSWPFYSRLELLIGSNLNKGKGSPPDMPMAPPQPRLPLSQTSPPFALPLAYRKPISLAMVTPMTRPPKLPVPTPMPVDGPAYFRKNYSAMAAAAAAAEEEGEEDDGGFEGDEAEGSEDRADEEEEEVADDGLRRLAKAIESFGEIYEKVECMKQRQMVELEKQRMQFTKDLEVQRMQLFMDTRIQLEKVKRAKRNGSSSGYGFGGSIGSLGLLLYLL